MQNTDTHIGKSVAPDQRAHVARLFHAVRIARGHTHWDARSQGVMAALGGQAKLNPFPFDVVPANEFRRGVDVGMAALERMSRRAFRIESRRNRESYAEGSPTSASGMFAPA